MTPHTRPLKILFVTKRQYMNKDVMDDLYGRFREVPLELARLGHDVKAIAFSYRQRNEDSLTDSENGATVEWSSINLGHFALPGILRYWREINKQAEGFQPDVILAASDAFHSIAGVKLAQQVGALSAVDLYDNFESYTGTKLPGVFSTFKRSLRDADIVTCISAPLEKHLRNHYNRTGPTMVLENGVRTDLFRPQDKRAARAALNLPQGKIFIGTAGALERSRDIEVLFRAADQLAAQNPQIELVVAGPRDPHLNWPTKAIVHDLNVLPHAETPTFFNALDVMVVMNKASDFGRFCHPQKLIEAAACGTPIVAPNLGTMSELFSDDPKALFETGNPDSLTEAVQARLAAGIVGQAQYSDWATLAGRLSDALVERRNAKCAGNSADN